MGGRWDSQITMPGAEAPDGGVTWSFFNAITPGYFEALGIPVKSGRDFRWSDWNSGRKLATGERSAGDRVPRKYDGGRPLLGHGAKVTPDIEVIGVFGNARYDDVRGRFPRQVFVNMGSASRGWARSSCTPAVHGDPRPVMAHLREQVRRVDPNLVVTDMRTMDDQVNRRISNERLLSVLSGAFAVLASLLAVIGLHGVLGFVVARRTREIGIRMALGAGRTAVVRMVLREMLPVIACGIAAGVVHGIALRPLRGEPTLRCQGLRSGGVRDQRRGSGCGGYRCGRDSRLARLADRSSDRDSSPISCWNIRPPDYVFQLAIIQDIWHLARYSAVRR